MKPKLKILSTSQHRNGICGAPFNVSLFQDTDGSTKVCVDFGQSYYAVLQVDLLAAGDIAFGSNSWRGDHYVDEVRKLAKKQPTAVSDDALFIRHL